MANLNSDIKRFLRGKRIELEKLVDERQKIKDQLEDDRLDVVYKQNVLMPKHGEIRHKINLKKAEVDSAVKQMTEQAKQQVFALNDIKGEDLTEDAKLFSCGVKLSEKDVEKIIDRNGNNPTMIQLSLRYAKENGLKVQRVYNNHSAEMKACDDQYSIAHLYIDHWIDKDNSADMLEKFYPED